MVGSAGSVQVLVCGDPAVRGLPMVSRAGDVTVPASIMIPATTTPLTSPMASGTAPFTAVRVAMQAFLDAEAIDLHRIVHGEQRFAYVRPLAVGDELSATLTVTGLRQIGGADIIATTSEITDATGAVVCTGKATLVHSSGGAA